MEHKYLYDLVAFYTFAECQYHSIGQGVASHYPYRLFPLRDSNILTLNPIDPELGKFSLLGFDLKFPFNPNTAYNPTTYLKSVEKYGDITNENIFKLISTTFDVKCSILIMDQDERDNLGKILGVNPDTITLQKFDRDYGSFCANKFKLMLRMCAYSYKDALKKVIQLKLTQK